MEKEAIKITTLISNWMNYRKVMTLQWNLQVQQ